MGPLGVLPLAWALAAGVWSRGASGCPTLAYGEGLSEHAEGEPGRSARGLLCAEALDSGPTADFAPRLAEEIVILNKPPSDLEWRSIETDCEAVGLRAWAAVVAHRYFCQAGIYPHLCGADVPEETVWWVWACAPRRCDRDLSSDLLLPRFFEWTALPRRVPTLPAAGACGRPWAPGAAWRLDDTACAVHLAAAAAPRCSEADVHWRIAANRKLFFTGFGFLVRELHDMEENPLADEVARYSYSRCTDTGWTFHEATMLSQRRETFHLSVCLPPGCTNEAALPWAQKGMDALAPGATVVNFRAQELVTRGELNLQWIIVGVNRCGSTSLASWLAGDPRLRLLHDAQHSCKEGGANYLFRRSLFQTFVPKHWADELHELVEPEVRRGLAVGLKEPWALRSSRGRAALAEMPQLRLLAVVKDWLEWLKSTVVFGMLPKGEVPAGWPGMRACVRELAVSANRSWSWQSMPADPPDAFCHVEWHTLSVVPQLRDLLRRGFPKRRLKLLHLAVLQQETTGPARLADWLRGGAAAPSGDRPPGSDMPFPYENNFGVDWTVREFFGEICALPPALAGNLDRARRRALHGLATLLRELGERAPEGLGPAAAAPRASVQAEACRRAAALAAAVP